SCRSDLFSLGVITYQMLSGRLPYGAQVAKSRTRAAQLNLSYHSVRDSTREVPAWIDDVLKKATHPDPAKRYGELSEFLFELRQPNQALLNTGRAAQAEREPVFSWKGVSLIQALTVVVLLLRSVSGAPCGDGRVPDKLQPHLCNVTYRAMPQ